MALFTHSTWYDFKKVTDLEQGEVIVGRMI